MGNQKDFERYNRWMRSGVLLFTFLAMTASAQDLIKTLPKNYSLIFQNDHVRVVRVRYGPHEKLPVHDHPDKPTVYVYLTDSGSVRFMHVEKHAFTTTRDPLKAGAFRLTPGRLEKHTVENLSDIPTEFLRVELLRVPIGFEHHTFHDRGPFDLSRTLVTTAFPGPYVRIDRVVAAGHEKVELGDNAEPALLVALTPSRASERRLNTGDVLWLEPHREESISSSDVNSIAHLLRIEFLPVVGE